MNLEWARISDTIAYQPYWQSESPYIRSAVCLSIGKIQSPALFPILAALSKDSDSLVVVDAIFSLGQMRDDQSADLLVKLYDNPMFRGYQIDIINALGKSENKIAYEFLIKQCEFMDNSILPNAIESIAYLTKEETRSRSTGIIKKYLDTAHAKVRLAAIYFFARHPYPAVLAQLIRSKVTDDENAFKYRFRAIDKAMTPWQMDILDSSLIDSLHREVSGALKKKNNPWQTRLYQIGILGKYDDSVSVVILSEQLQDSIPHVRSRAIQALGEKDSEQARQLLLNYYNRANWGEKGNIIFELSRHERDLAFRLIQQNLDQGTLFFKQLLLRSLGRIRDRASIIQLRQFLQVPNIRLQQTAFMELNTLNLIRYNDVKPMLASKDMVLIWLAADWISNHPDKANLDDLIMTYNNLSEQKDVESMSALLSAISTMKNRAAIPFLQSALQGTKRSEIKDEIVRILTELDVKIEALPQTPDSLFIPPEIIDGNTSVAVRIETEKGDITLQLRPDVAPLTVSNFLYLIRKGFYENTTFHRVVSDFVIQGGDPRGDGWGGPGYNIPCEYNRLPFKRGTLGLATAGKDTGSSQFFICHSEQPHLDRRYTVFGEVIEGMEVVDKIQIDDKINKITIKN